MTKIIGIVATKGGVGKTTIAASLAADLVNHQKKKVLLVDANYSSPNLGFHMDVINPEKTIHDVIDGKAEIGEAIYNRYGVDVIPGSLSYPKRVNLLKLKDKIDSIKDNYDFVIIDSSPSLNDEMLSTLFASDHLFVVTTPDAPTLSCSLKTAQVAKNRGKNVSGIIVNKIRNPDYELTFDEIQQSTGIPVVARLPDSEALTKSVFTRIPMSVFKRNSAFSKEIGDLSAALVGTKENLPFWRRIVNAGFKKEEVNRQLLRRSFYDNVFMNRP